MREGASRSPPANPAAGTRRMPRVGVPGEHPNVVPSGDRAAGGGAPASGGAGVRTREGASRSPPGVASRRAPHVAPATIRSLAATSADRRTREGASRSAGARFPAGTVVRRGSAGRHSTPGACSAVPWRRLSTGGTLSTPGGNGEARSAGRPAAAPSSESPCGAAARMDALGPRSHGRRPPPTPQTGGNGKTGAAGGGVAWARFGSPPIPSSGAKSCSTPRRLGRDLRRRAGRPGRTPASIRAARS